MLGTSRALSSADCAARQAVLACLATIFAPALCILSVNSYDDIFRSDGDDRDGWSLDLV